MPTHKIPFKPHFGAFVIESLTVGMYGESRNALREYIQNSFDSLREAIIQGLIGEDDAIVQVTLDSDRNGLTIRDQGGGLSIGNASAVLASIGASNKDYRRNAGFRGIGRLAGIVFCDTLTFRTKAAGETQRSVIVFDAKGLREKLTPSKTSAADAATVLESCVEARLEDETDLDAHYFEVQLHGFHNPPNECRNYDALKTFLSQVSPLPYRNDFPHREQILEAAKSAGLQIEWIRLFARDGEKTFEELFKPYGADFSVKKNRVPLSGIDYVVSPRAKWWGWVGRKKVSGAFQDAHSSGIRVRVRNIQIDDTQIIRDIFAVSYRGGAPRKSYARFADWYIGEIFVHPNAAIPNARRDGFEEDDDWLSIRSELDELVAEKYGKLAYKTSTGDQLSVETLTKRFAEFQKVATPLVAQGVSDWDRVSRAVVEANDMQKRLGQAVAIADENELTAIRSMGESLSTMKRQLDSLVVDAPNNSCDEEIAIALSEYTQKLYRALKQRLPPAEWQRVREVIQSVSGEEPL